VEGVSPLTEPMSDMGKSESEGESESESGKRGGAERWFKPDHLPISRAFHGHLARAFHDGEIAFVSARAVMRSTISLGQIDIGHREPCRSNRVGDAADRKTRCPGVGSPWIDATRTLLQRQAAVRSAATAVDQLRFKRKRSAVG